MQHCQAKPKHTPQETPEAAAATDRALLPLLLLLPTPAAAARPRTSLHHRHRSGGVSLPLRCRCRRRNSLRRWPLTLFICMIHQNIKCIISRSICGNTSEGSHSGCSLEGQSLLASGAECENPGASVLFNYVSQKKCNNPLFKYWFFFLAKKPPAQMSRACEVRGEVLWARGRSSCAV